MNTLVKVVAWAYLILAIVGLLWLPADIGKEQGTYTAGKYVISLITSAMVVLLCGRVLGWW